MTEVTEQDQPRWWQRVRAAVGLSVLLLCLGIATAAVVGVVALGLATLFDQALG